MHLLNAEEVVDIINRSSLINNNNYCISEYYIFYTINKQFSFQHAGMSFCRGSVNCRVSDGQMYDLCESSRSVEIFVGGGGGVGVRQHADH